MINPEQLPTWELKSITIIDIMSRMLLKYLNT